MDEFFRHLQGDHLISLASVVMFWGVALAAVISMSWTYVRKMQFDAELKRIMIEQGRSADEIAKILTAHSSVRGSLPELLMGRSQPPSGPKRSDA